MSVAAYSTGVAQQLDVLADACSRCCGIRLDGCIQKEAAALPGATPLAESQAGASDGNRRVTCSATMPSHSVRSSAVLVPMT